MSQLLGYEVGPLSDLDVRACRGITGQLYAKLENEGRVQRVEHLHRELRAVPRNRVFIAPGFRSHSLQARHLDSRHLQ